MSPAGLNASTGAALHVRSAGEPSQLVASVRRELEAIDPAMPPGLTVRLTDYMGAAYFEQRTAALLLARHRELIGQPRRVKEILCRTATDLGREPRFQGSGMVDVLRALQSI